MLTHSLSVLSVGIGSDFDGIGSVPEGLEDVSKYPALVSTEDIILLSKFDAESAPSSPNCSNEVGIAMSLAASLVGTYFGS